VEVGDGGISVAVSVNVGTAVSVNVGGMVVAVSVGGTGEGDKVNGISLATTVAAKTVSFAGSCAV
jgi:hypothetical protein